MFSGHTDLQVDYPFVVTSHQLYCDEHLALTTDAEGSGAQSQP